MLGGVGGGSRKAAPYPDLAATHLLNCVENTRKC